MRPANPTTCGEVSEEPRSRLGDRWPPRPQAFARAVGHLDAPGRHDREPTGNRKHLVLAHGPRDIVSKTIALPEACSNPESRSLIFSFSAAWPTIVGLRRGWLVGAPFCLIAPRCTRRAGVFLGALVGGALANVGLYNALSAVL
jgi:hypothetical protein